MNEYEKHRYKVNLYLERMGNNISDIERRLKDLSTEIKLLKNDVSEFMDVAAEDIAEKIINLEKSKTKDKKSENK